LQAFAVNARRCSSEAKAAPLGAGCVAFTIESLIVSRTPAWIMRQRSGRPTVASTTGPAGSLPSDSIGCSRPFTSVKRPEMPQVPGPNWS
jgi:hypothetical protein